MPRHSRSAKLREDALLTQTNSVNKESTGSPQTYPQAISDGKRLGPRGIDKWNWPAARLFKAMTRAHPNTAENLATDLHVTKQLVSSWSKEDAANHAPVAAPLKLSQHGACARLAIEEIARISKLRVAILPELTPEQVAEETETREAQARLIDLAQTLMKATRSLK